VPTLSSSELAENYGFALSFFKSNKELWRVFNKAVKGNWSSAKFQAALKNTNWYRTTSKSYRDYVFAKSDDPASMAAKITNTAAQIIDAANTMGAKFSYKTALMISRNSISHGWSDSQLRDYLARYVRVKNGVFHGEAADTAEALRETAWRNGIRISSTTLQSYARAIARGDASVDEYKRRIRKSAASLAPDHADQLAAGQDLYDIAQPYMQSMASTLEIPATDIDLFDRTIRSALSNRDSKGRPVTKTLWEFERDLRQDSRWLKTNKARDEMSSTARQVLSTFGFQGV
jgi:hypothetical protein